MDNQGVTKRDWVLFRDRVPRWQEVYMDKLNQEYIELLSADGPASEKFWNLNKRIQEDRKSTGVQIEMTKSNLIPNIVSLINDGVIVMQDLDGFSEELRVAVSHFCGQ